MSKLKTSFAVIASYDVMLMFSREVECIWRIKPSVLTALYVTIRYGMLMRTILQLLVPNSAMVRVCIYLCTNDDV